ncbi:jg643 [Pararge aegeria aegeria]|uniref:Jg643 protein n=1 Tax=Pararge aegeria aegeria TaxID=348720 RepID=A0A8S4QWE3_9NEOP|nr:jg643 [Pararge aegeria aegeria]
MIKNQVLEPAPPTASFISPLFIIPKNNGKSRVIFNLKALNRYMLPKHFRLFHHHQMPKFLQPGDWMVKLDLSQAYYHIPIKEDHRRYLRISYKGQLLQMTCLPFGLAAAPRMFASVTNWTAQVLRDTGLRLVVYLDDYLIVHQSEKILRTHVQLAIQFLTNLGWCVNIEKSITTPSRSLEYLGVKWDTDLNVKSLPLDKITKVRQILISLLASGSWTLKQAQRLLGYLNFATFVTHRGRLHCRTIQRHSNCLRQHPRKSRQFPKKVRVELEWWLQNLIQTTPIHPKRRPTNYVITDASDVQWGALVNNSKITGTWNRKQQKFHCNLKEMYAVIAAISTKASTLKNSTVVLQSDNKTVVSYIKNEGGTRSARLLDLTKELFNLTDSLNIVLLPHHLPGVYNTEADKLSRNQIGSEWHLQERATSKIFELWGTPNIDLFASQSAHVVQNYATLDLSDLNSCFHDAFSTYWRYELAWIFPPPGLLPRVLQHLNSAEGRYIIIAPKWKKPFWRPDLKSRSLTRPVKIRRR